MEKNIGRSEFEKLCFLSPNELLDGAPPLVIKDNGIWTWSFSDQDTILLTKAEMAIVKDHPQQDLFRPALAFPCTVKQFLSFMRWALLKAYIDTKKLSKLINNRHRHKRKKKNLEILGTKKEQQNKRMDGMAVEIEAVIDYLEIKKEPINVESVFSKLCSRIGKIGSVCIDSDVEKIGWFGKQGRKKYLNKKALQGRLDSRSKRLKRQKDNVQDMR